jgi:hypothetical protein
LYGVVTLPCRVTVAATGARCGGARDLRGGGDASHSATTALSQRRCYGVVTLPCRVTVAATGARCGGARDLRGGGDASHSATTALSQRR